MLGRAVQFSDAGQRLGKPVGEHPARLGRGRMADRCQGQHQFDPGLVGWQVPGGK